MRTTTLLLAAAITAAGIASIQAQSNVYSVNVVGYYNVTVPPAPTQFRMIANQFNTTNNTLNGVLKNLPSGTLVLKWTGATFSIHEFASNEEGWDPNTSLAPGEGVFIRNVDPAQMTVTFVGEVPQGSLTNPIPQGFEIESSMVPQAGGVQSVLGLPVNEAGGDYVYKWKATAGGGYDIFEYGGGGPSGWDPSEPTVAVGESFFSRKNLAPQTWVRNFTVNP
jgi:hypothetical protein